MRPLPVIVSRTSFDWEGKDRYGSIISLVDKCVGVQVKLSDPSTTRAIQGRFCDEAVSYISSVSTFALDSEQFKCPRKFLWLSTHKVYSRRLGGGFSNCWGFESESAHHSRCSDVTLGSLFVSLWLVHVFTTVRTANSSADSREARVWITACYCWKRLKITTGETTKYDKILHSSGL